MKKVLLWSLPLLLSVGIVLGKLGGGHLLMAIFQDFQKDPIGAWILIICVLELTLIFSLLIFLVLYFWKLYTNAWKKHTLLWLIPLGLATLTAIITMICRREEHFDGFFFMMMEGIWTVLVFSFYLITLIALALWKWYHNRGATTQKILSYIPLVVSTLTILFWMNAVGFMNFVYHPFLLAFLVLFFSGLTMTYYLPFKLLIWCQKLQNNVKENAILLWRLPFMLSALVCAISIPNHDYLIRQGHYWQALQEYASLWLITSFIFYLPAVIVSLGWILFKQGAKNLLKYRWWGSLFFADAVLVTVIYQLSSFNFIKDLLIASLMGYGTLLVIALLWALYNRPTQQSRQAIMRKALWCLPGVLSAIIIIVSHFLIHFLWSRSESRLTMAFCLVVTIACYLIPVLIVFLYKVYKQVWKKRALLWLLPLVLSFASTAWMVQGKGNIYYSVQAYAIIWLVASFIFYLPAVIVVLGWMLLKKDAKNLIKYRWWWSLFLANAVFVMLIYQQFSFHFIKELLRALL